jgi:DNA-binding NtrC family response regulator
VLIITLISGLNVPTKDEHKLKFLALWPFFIFGKTSRNRPQDTLPDLAHFLQMEQEKQHRVVILETNKDKRDYFRSVVSAWGDIPFLFEKETICLDNMSTLKPDLLISGTLPIQGVYRLIHTLKANGRRIPVIIVSKDPAVSDFIVIHGFADVAVIHPDLSPSEMKSAINTLMENALRCDVHREGPMIVGNSPEMLKIKELVAGVSRLNEATLIFGEPGTGKELLAKAIHCNSNRRCNPFIKIYAPGLSEGFFETKNKPCPNESARGGNDTYNDVISALENGTLFIDEIGALPPHLQAWLLRIFEEDGIREFAKGEIDVGVVASSSESLEQLVKLGKFRKDLYYRLNVVLIKIPPLRDRVSDIPLLTDFFADQFCIEFKKSHFELYSNTKDVLCRYPWPGNVGELEDTIRKVVLFNQEKVICASLAAKNRERLVIKEFEDISELVDPQDLKKYIKELNHISLKDICRVFMERAEKKIMKKALDRTSWNRRKASKMLDISYKSLLNKMKEYRIAL